MSDEIMSIIVKGVITIIVGCMGVLIPYLFQMLKIKIGNDKFDRVVSITALAKKIIIAYFKSNPDKETSAKAIIEQFKNEMLKVIPTLTESELNFLFNSIIDDITKELNLDSNTFQIVQNFMLGEYKAIETEVEKPLFFN